MGITVETATVYSAGKGRKRRLTLRAACLDFARDIVRKMARESGDDLHKLLEAKRGQIYRVAAMMERRLKRRPPPAGT
jgi:hypothetical protein